MIYYKFDHDTLTYLYRIAKKRNGIKGGPGTLFSRRISDIQIHYVGLKGEWAVAKALSQEIDLTVSHGGDTGHDLSYAGMTIDVKVGRGTDLIFYVNKFRADAAILVRAYNKSTELPGLPLHTDPRLLADPELGWRDVVLVGWITKKEFYGRCIRKDYGYGPRQVVPMENLNDMIDLFKMRHD